jgi:8-oxo-dGDP phosphatase
VSENPWQTLSTRIIYTNHWLRLREDQVIRPDGSPGIYSVVEMRPSVGIVAVNEADEVALVAQWRYTLGRASVEIPTGGSEISDPDMLAAAQRELREETGVTARHWRELGFVDNSNGVTNDTAYMFLATDLQAGEATPDPEEQVTLSWRPFGQVVQDVLNGSITEAVSTTAVLKVDALRRQGTVIPGIPARA